MHRSLLSDGGGLLRGEQYHMDRVCQRILFSEIQFNHVLARPGPGGPTVALCHRSHRIDGEFNSILASQFIFPALSNHLIRPRQHVRRDRQADLLGGFQIDDQLELRRLLDGNVSRLGAMQNPIHVICSTTEDFSIAR
jgi:hypothetical protein